MQDEFRMNILRMPHHAPFVLQGLQGKLFHGRIRILIRLDVFQPLHETCETIASLNSGQFVSTTAGSFEDKLSPKSRNENTYPEPCSLATHIDSL